MQLSRALLLAVGLFEAVLESHALLVEHSESVPPPGDYDEIANHYCPGGQIERIDGLSLDQCKYHCDADSTCIAFVRSFATGPTHGRCFFKAAAHCDKTVIMQPHDTRSVYWKDGELDGTVNAALAGLATANGDPHLESVSGDKFDVNQPGGYTLLRVPADPTLPAKLEVNASLKAIGSSPCGLYIQDMQFSGTWFEEALVRVKPLQRDMPGSNGAGSKTLRPFSLQVEGGRQGAAAVNDEPWAKEFTKRLSEHVHVQSLWRQPYADAGHVMEAEAFKFFIRGGTAQAASVEVSQASHQALDVAAAGLSGLGFKQLGGLLGTEGHDKGIERVTSECAALKKMNGGANTPRTSLRLATQGSTMGASWGGPP